MQNLRIWVKRTFFVVDILSSFTFLAYNNNGFSGNWLWRVIIRHPYSTLSIIKALSRAIFVFLFVNNFSSFFQNIKIFPLYQYFFISIKLTTKNFQIFSYQKKIFWKFSVNFFFNLCSFQTNQKYQYTHQYLFSDPLITSDQLRGYFKV